jgi:putative tryptophan/tyrosine transport system substrate-binding protein
VAAELAAELVHLPVDVIAVALGPTVKAARMATASIPIVMLNSGDPVITGAVASYARPGGNITGLGMLTTELAGKRLQLLKEAVPGLSRAAALLEPSAENAYELQATQVAAEKLGVELLPLEIHQQSDIDGALSTLVNQRIEGLVVFTHGFARRYRNQILAAAATNRLPVMYGDREYVVDGGLISYGPNWSRAFYRAATYVDKILKGTKPADLPVEMPMTFDFVVNLKTAQALGITFPPEILLQVTEVVE